MAIKHDSALFVLGNHQKKRPDNIIFGRMYADHLLDMLEFGVSDFKSIESFKNADTHSFDKPMLMF